MAASRELVASYSTVVVSPPGSLYNGSMNHEPTKTDQSMDQPADKFMYQSMAQSVGQPADQSVDQPADQSMGQQLMHRSVDQPVGQPADQTVTDGRKVFGGKSRRWVLIGSDWL